MKPLDFNLKASFVPVTLHDEEGKAIKYELREMSSFHRDKYMDVLKDRVEFGEDGKPKTLKRFDGLNVDLVSSCIYKEGEKTPVKREEVQQWPSSVVEALYQEATKLNHIGVETKEVIAEIKNDSQVSDAVGSG